MPSMRVLPRLPLAAAAAVVAAGACTHAPALHDGVFQKSDRTVHLGPVPPGWQRVHVDGADLAWRDQGLEGSALFDLRCHQRDDDAPLPVLTEHLIMGTTDREVQSQETIPFDGREALHTLMLAKLDGVPMQYDIYVMKKDGCVYDLVYVAPPSRYAAGSADFERFARGLHAASPPVAVGGDSAEERSARSGGAGGAAPSSDP